MIFSTKPLLFDKAMNKQKPIQNNIAAWVLQGVTGIWVLYCIFDKNHKWDSDFFYGKKSKWCG